MENKRRTRSESSPPTSPKAKVEKRETVQVPTEWHTALIRVAAKWKQQKIWALCRLIGEACEAEGIERPMYPWEKIAADLDTKEDS